MTPRVDVVEMEGNGMMALSGNGIGYGGSASDFDDIFEADVNEGIDWDIW